MTSLTRARRLLIAGIAAAATALPMAQAAHAGPPAPSVPPEIAVEDGNKLFLVGHAVGVQIYACKATAGGYSWGFVAPRAELYGDNGKPITTHFGGPTWRATDGSSAVGTLVRPAPVDPTAIPWLLLSAKGTAGPDGDRLAATTFIQRTATTGGLIPPADQCHARDRRHPEGDPLHRRLLLLEARQCLTCCAGGAGSDSASRAQWRWLCRPAPRRPAAFCSPIHRPALKPAPTRGADGSSPLNFVAPAISGLRVAPARFALGNGLPRMLTARAARGRTQIRFELSEHARVRFTFRRARREGFRRVRGSFTVEASEGANRVRFAGRLTARRRLAPGRYRLIATPVDALGNTGRSRRATFTLTDNRSSR